MLRAPRAVPFPISSFDFLPADVNLDTRNVRPQCYDGVGNMSGKYNSVQEKILE
jgi:hypothetical protein